MPAACNNLSPKSLVRSLVASSREVESLERPKQWQIHNISCIARRIKLLSVLFEEIDDARSYNLSRPAVLCFRELWATIQRAKSLMQRCAKRSRIWNLMENESVSRQFHALNKDMAKALDILPLVDVTQDVREHVDLLHRQTGKTTELFVDAEDERVRRELVEMMRNFEVKKAPNPDRLRAVFRRLGLNNPADCRREIRLLQDETAKQAGTGGVAVISAINNLISLVVYAKCVLFGVEYDLAASPCSPSFHEAIGPPGDQIPNEMRCPISLDLMRDPVIVETGHTYDRASISQWIDSGHSTCPNTGQRLVHGALVPNYALRSLISQWCHDRNVSLDRNSQSNNLSTWQAAIEAVKMSSAFLVGKIATGSPEIQCQAAYKLRLLAKCGMDNRKCIAEAGAVPFLVHLLSSDDPRTQENAVTALLNLSICDGNKSLIMSAPGALDSIIQVLERGSSMESRENAAATLFSLSVANELKVAIGSRPAAVPALVGLLREGSSRGKKDAATALFNLSMYDGNKPLVVRAGAVPLLVRLLTDENAGITDDALTVLAMLAGSEEGLTAIKVISDAIPVLIDLIGVGSPKGKENAVAVLVAMCRSGGEDMVARLLLVPSTIPSLQTLVSVGSLRAKRKAASLLKLLNADPDRH